MASSMSFGCSWRPTASGRLSRPRNNPHSVRSERRMHSTLQLILQCMAVFVRDGQNYDELTRRLSLPRNLLAEASQKVSVVGNRVVCGTILRVVKLINQTCFTVRTLDRDQLSAAVDYRRQLEVVPAGPHDGCPCRIQILPRPIDCFLGAVHIRIRHAIVRRVYAVQVGCAYWPWRGPACPLSVAAVINRTPQILRFIVLALATPAPADQYARHARNYRQSPSTRWHRSSPFGYLGVPGPAQRSSRPEHHSTIPDAQHSGRTGSRKATPA